MSSVGHTKTQGWEVGVRKTLPITPEHAWETIMTQPGLNLWFGKEADTRFEKGASFQTAEGNTGKVVSYREGSLLRLRWQPNGWSSASTLQVRVIPAGDKATISFHHEMLQTSDQRVAMKQQWRMVLDQLEVLALE